MAIRFDASTDSLSRTANLPTITSFTMMGWFYISVDRNAYSDFLAFGQNASNFYYNWGTGSDGTTLELWNSSVSGVGSALTVGAWNHLAMTCAGTGAGQLVGYLNGAANATLSGSASPTNARMWIANDPDSGWLNGRASAIKIYSAVLTAAEIAQEMRQIAPARTANLNGFYPLWRSPEAATDYSGNGYNWTAGGSLSTEDGPPVPWNGRNRLYRAYPTTATAVALAGRQFASTGSFAWSNPFNAATSNDSRATVTIGEFDTGSGLGVSQPLIATNFGFSIPSDATINGIIANIEGLTSGAGGECFVALTKTGTADAGTGKATALSTSESTITRGSSSDLWGTTWTGAEINAPTFGLRIYGQCFEFQTSRTHSIDYVTITIRYNESGGGAQTITVSASVSGTALHQPQNNLTLLNPTLVSNTTLYSPTNTQSQTITNPNLVSGTVVRSGQLDLTLLPGLLSTTAYYGPTMSMFVAPNFVSANTVTHNPQLNFVILPSQISSTSYYNPQLNQQIIGNLISTTAYHQPTMVMTVAPGAIGATTVVRNPQLNFTLLPGLISGTALYNPQLNLTLLPGAQNNTTYHSPSLTGASIVSPPLVTGTSLYNPQLNLTVLPSHFNNTAYYQPTQSLNITPNLLSVPAVVQNAQLNLALLPGVLSSTSVYGALVTLYVSPPNIGSTVTVYQPGVATGNQIATVLVGPTSTVHTPLEILYVTPNAVASSTAVPSAAVNFVILPNAVAASTTVYNPTEILYVVPNAPVQNTTVRTPSTLISGIISNNLLGPVSTVYGPRLDFTLLPPVISSNVQVYNPSLLSGFVVSPGLVIGPDTVVYGPALNQNIIPSWFSATQLYSAVLGRFIIPSLTGPDTQVRTPSLTAVILPGGIDQTQVYPPARLDRVLLTGGWTPSTVVYTPFVGDLNLSYQGIFTPVIVGPNWFDSAFY